MRFIQFLVLLLMLPLAGARAADIPTILLFGDSIVAGYGLDEKDVLSKKLEASLHQNGLKAKVVNGGVSGDTTASGRSRLAWTLKQYNPDVVLLALGANDMLRGLPAATTRENIDAMLKELTSDKKRRVILSAVVAPGNLGPVYSGEFNAIYRDLAKQHGVALYPFLLDGVYGTPGLMLTDGIHPNDKGVEAIAEKLSAYLRANVLK